MLSKKLIFICIVLSALITSSYRISTDDPIELLGKMLDKNNDIKTLQVTAVMKERIEGKQVDKKTFFKINMNPRKIYFRQKFIGIDVEGLFVAGRNNNKASMTTIGFPWISASFDPLDQRVRNNHHHTMFEAGFDYFVTVIRFIINKYEKDLPKMISYQGIVQKNNRDCYKLIVDNPNFRYQYYKVQKGENLPSIAKKFMINDFMILEKNTEIKDYYDVKEGQQIIIPCDYAKKMIFFMDKELLVPIHIEIYDDLGLYAEYSYQDVILNPVFAPNEFDESFPGYHF
jgi:outer membrane lipoprotein-sorting protein